MVLYDARLDVRQKVPDTRRGDDGVCEILLGAATK